MSDPCEELQAAIKAALRADPALLAMFQAGGRVRVYDVPPDNLQGDYFTLGEDDLAPDQAECIEGAEVTATVHVWSETDPPGLARAKALGALAIACVLDLPDLPSHRVDNVQLVSSRYLVDADGVTAHGVLILQVNTAPV